MIWLNPNDYMKRQDMELRLYAPKNELILLLFNPLRISDEPDWSPSFEDWNCYAKPLRIYEQDYNLLLDYFNTVYPTINSFDGTVETAFNVCFDNWIRKDDWLKIISEIEQDLENIPDNEKPFFTAFIEWLGEALKHTSIIVVEGNQ